MSSLLSFKEPVPGVIRHAIRGLMILCKGIFYTEGELRKITDLIEEARKEGR